MRKRIILLLDGTWNDADFGLSDTNIVRTPRDHIGQSNEGTPFSNTGSERTRVAAWSKDRIWTIF